MTDGKAEWLRVEAALDIILALPAADRSAAVERLAGTDDRLRGELHSLLAQMGGDDPVLDRPFWTRPPDAPAQTAVFLPERASAPIGCSACWAGAAWVRCIVRSAPMVNTNSSLR